MPFPFSRVGDGDFGLGKMVFLWVYWSMGLRLGFFYGGLAWCGSSGGSILGVVGWVFRWVEG